ncbi:zinc-dependent metalloprotease [Bdellovibrio bacteriovorus]|uniref:zinc-dependent metalloprotease n=1 Tax=Bdellovibrio bacteriovorus TaxID=959 RepID=UPI0035A6EF49
MAVNKNILVVGALLSSTLLSACTQFEAKPLDQIIQAKQAPANSLSTFSNPADIPANAACKQASCVTIQKSSLGKIFLLMASGITSGMTPQWYDLKPLVVSFEKSGNRLALIGENYNSIYSEIRTVNLIQSFEVISEDATSITFDWGQGLKSFVLQRSYDVDAPRGNVDLTDSSLASLPVMDSFVTGIKFDEKNIELNQLSKIRSDNIKVGSDKSLNHEPREETLNMNIQIRAYDLSKNFKAKEYDSSRRVGFFVTKYRKLGYSKEMTNLITKWDISPEKGPIKVRISEAVPEDYVAAVTEGALYWNKVFGRDVIQVVSGVPVDAKPEDRSIIVRWIPWLDSGAAYAIGQSDPLTGELLRAQVFMPSVFTSVGSADLVKLNGDVPVVAAGAIACDLTESLNALNKIAREAGDSQRLRLAQDSVRATVAHELGHALGLRHNFAGSSSAKVSTQEIYESAKTYLRDPNHQGLETSTSIMDYVSGIDDILMSGRIKYAALSYDKMAMDWAYSDNNTALDEKVSRYCTDDDIAVANSQGLQIYGCERFDAGNNPLLRKYLDAVDERDDLVKVLFASIIGRMYPADKPGVVRDLDAVLADTVKWGRANIDLSFVSQVLFDSTKASQPAASFASLAAVKTGKIMYARLGLDEQLMKERAASLKEAGGYAALLNGLMRDKNGNINMKWLDQQIDELKAAPYLAQGKTLGGREYALSDAQQRKILKFMDSIRPVNDKVLLVAGAALLPKMNEVVEDANGAKSVVTSVLGQNLLDESEAESLTALYLDLAQAATGTIVVKLGPGLSKEVTLPYSWLKADEKAYFGKLLSSQGLRFDMTLRVAKARSEQLQKIAGLLIEIDPSLDPVTEANLNTLPQRLLTSGLVDAAAAAWLKAEIEVLNVLSKIQ